MSGVRIESDSMGQIEVENNRYWGAQTQRSLQNFEIGEILFTRPFIRAYGILKLSCAWANGQLGVMDPEKSNLICKAAQEVIDGKLDDHFLW